MAATHFQQLRKAKSSFCAGKTTKSTVRKKVAAYIKNAVKKAGPSAAEKKKAKAEAKRIANRELNKSCSTAAVGKKRKLRVKHVVYGRRKKAAHKKH
jgi:hypothetical protein